MVFEQTVWVFEHFRGISVEFGKWSEGDILSEHVECSMWNGVWNYLHDEDWRVVDRSQLLCNWLWILVALLHDVSRLGGIR